MEDLIIGCTYAILGLIVIAIVIIKAIRWARLEAKREQTKNTDWTLLPIPYFIWPLFGLSMTAYGIIVLGGSIFIYLADTMMVITALLIIRLALIDFKLLRTFNRIHDLVTPWEITNKQFWSVLTVSGIISPTLYGIYYLAPTDEAVYSLLKYRTLFLFASICFALIFVLLIMHRLLVWIYKVKG
jgi:hypothetical protein